MPYVYLLQELDFDGDPTGLYKIGQTKTDVGSRKRQYQAGNARQVIEFHSIYVDNAQSVETQLHQYFAANRIIAGGGDEWFRFLDISVVIDVMEEFSEYSQTENPQYVNHAYTPRYTDSYTEEDFPWGWAVGIIVVIGMFISASQQGQIQHGRSSVNQADSQKYRTDFPIASRVKIVQRANVREKALENSKLLAEAEVGDVAIVQETYGAWIRLKFKSGVDGWVYDQALEPVR
jgi:hypothetical protein